MSETDGSACSPRHRAIRFTLLTLKTRWSVGFRNRQAFRYESNMALARHAGMPAIVATDMQTMSRTKGLRVTQGTERVILLKAFKRTNEQRCHQGTKRFDEEESGSPKFPLATSKATAEAATSRLYFKSVWYLIIGQTDPFS
ncbi:hypothetical protein EVAR_6196_1 [Eumeta japonica]|uniref:Uncharacterized protein n=1 Tax=Eumeta variegata TaxID=151549 RepID=A0A4C2A2W0_EUMVA|nr:hypothetical protein EVAR_6196_1 [Eumeta japonica]